MPRYEAYKDSGVEWLGAIPGHWEIKTIKSLLAERKENNNPIKTTNILSLTMDRGVIPYAEKGAGGNKAKEDLTAYKLAYPGDIVLNSNECDRWFGWLVSIFRSSKPSLLYALSARR
jgi:type I restriction enzyme S subunit